MTHSTGDVQRIAELNAALMTLNDEGRDSALIILRALSFAQSVMDADTYEAAKTLAASRPQGPDG